MASPWAQAEPQGEAADRQHQRPDEPFLVGRDTAVLQVAAAEPLQFAVEPVARKPVDAQPERTHTTQRAQLVERLQVQVRRHDVPFLVLHEARGASLPVEGRDQPALGAPDPDRDHPDALLLAGVRLLLPVTLEVLAVGHQDDRLEPLRGGPALPALRKQLARRRQGRADVRALLGQHVGIGHLQEHVGRAVVQRQGALDERRAGEKDETDAAVLDALQETAQLGLGPLEATGRDVLGAHRIGDVEDDHHIRSPLRHGDLAGAPLRAGQRDQQPEQSRQEEEPVPPQQRSVAPLDVRCRAVAQEAAHPAPPLAVPQTQAQPEHRQQGHHPQPRLRGKPHGNLRSHAAPSAASAISSRRPGTANHAIRSRYQVLTVVL